MSLHYDAFAPPSDPQGCSAPPDPLVPLLVQAAGGCADPAVREWLRALAAGDGACSAEKPQQVPACARGAVQ